MLKTLRDLGLRTTIFEAGTDIGGTWRWNCYPGAAVDSEVPEYEFSWPEVYSTWTWKSNYPTYSELREYFDHVDRVVGVRKDCAFNTVVVGARFDTEDGLWRVKTKDGRVTMARYLVLGTGFVCPRAYSIPGLSSPDLQCEPGADCSLVRKTLHPPLARHGQISRNSPPQLLLAGHRNPRCEQTLRNNRYRRLGRADNPSLGSPRRLPNRLPTNAKSRPTHAQNSTDARIAECIETLLP
jgi:hypothetical protein